ncbi:MAG: flippase-like domain-containing protein [Planctomycetes bacterium]|nr:flippase-like domain-containing protein [Planctomycetota bacterium]
MRKRLLYLSSILLGIAGFSAIPFIVGLHDLGSAIMEVGWPCLVFFTANASMTLLIPAAGWWILMRTEGIPATYGDAVRANLMGYPLTLLTPSMYLGGEPLKTFYIAQRYSVQKRRVLATIIVAKFQELVAIVLAIIIATFLFVGHTDFFTRRNEALLIVLIVILAIFMGLLLAAFVGNFKPTVKLINLAASLRIARRKMARLRTLAEEMEGLIHAAFTRRVRVLLAAQGVTLLSAVSLFLRPWIFFLCLREEVAFEHLCMIFVVTNLVSCLTIIPGALGLFEGAMAASCSAAGIGDARGVAFAIVNRLSDLTLVMIGCWWIVHTGLSKIARGKEPALSPEDKEGLPTPDQIMGKEEPEASSQNSE